MGLKRRRIAHTQLNTESSRSHSVLSMRLVQYQNDISPNSLVKLIIFWYFAKNNKIIIFFFDIDER